MNKKILKALESRVMEKANLVEVSFSDLKQLVSNQALIGISNILKEAMVSTAPYDIEVSKDQNLVVVTALKGQAYINVSVEALYKYQKIGNFSSIELEVAGGDLSIMFFGVTFK